MNFVDPILSKLSDLIQRGRFENLEKEVLEIKSVPASGGEWKEIHKSINAFLNTRGGIVILGVKEEGKGTAKRYVLSGWKEDAEPKLKDFPKLFTDSKGIFQDLSDWIPNMKLQDIPGGRVALIYVNELSADRKFVYYDGVPFERILTGDHKIAVKKVESQEEYKEEALNFRELLPMEGLAESNLDITKLNQFIFQLNQPVPIETMKSDILQARSFLERRCFLKDGVVTVLGALVCALHPGERLGFRSHLHGYVDLAKRLGEGDRESQVVRDKQDFVDNVLQLMESGLGYLLRNIHVGITIREGGTSRSQYPDSLLRETVNNALAHRDYSIDRQVIIAIKPGKYIEIRNPGTFRKKLLIEWQDDSIPIRRILPEAKPKNPKLADVLRVFRKWEGRGIGMATLVNMCLQNQMDLPYYRLLSEEVCLFICTGQLLDERMERSFQSFDGYIEERLQGNALTEEQKLILSYLMKSEWANERLCYTVLLTPDNNHFEVLLHLEKCKLILKHAQSTPNYPIYIVDRVLMKRGYVQELKDLFGSVFDVLKPVEKQTLGMIYRFNHFSKEKIVSAKRASFALWYDGGGTHDGIEAFDSYYRKIRYVFNKLEKGGFIAKSDEKKKIGGYSLRTDYLKTRIF